jgi:hypothetical protein
MNDVQAKLISTIDKYMDSWSVRSKIEAALGPDADIGEVAWGALRDGVLEAKHAYKVEGDLKGRADLWGVDEYVTLLSDFARAFPDGRVYTSQYSYSWLWSDESLEGWSDLFHDLLEEKRQADPGFLPALAARVGDVPAPVRTGLSYMLAFHGQLSTDALPEDLIRELARRFLSKEGDSWDQRFVRDFNPWTDDEWDDALEAAVFDANLEKIDNLEALVALLPRIEDARIPRAIMKAGQRYRETLRVAEAIGARDASLLPVLEDAIVEAPEDTWKNDYNRPFAGFHLILSYAALCAAHGHTPDARLADAFARFVDGFSFGWSGSDFDAYRERVYAMLSVFPGELIDAALDELQGFNWEAAGALRTARGAREAANRLASATPDYAFNNHGVASFLALGPDLGIPPLAEVVLEDRISDTDMRVTATQILASYADARAGEALAHGLSDRSKKVREAAVEGVKGLPPEDALGYAEAALDARKKDTREAGATILLALPPSERRHEVAAARLTKEKSKSVKDLLELIEAFDGEAAQAEAALDLSDDVVASRVAHLESTQGKGWAELVEEHDSATAIALYARYLEKQAFDTYLYTWNDYVDEWVALLKTADPEAAVAAAVDVAGYFGDADYFDKFTETLPPDQLGDELARRLVSGLFERKPTAAETSWGATYRVKGNDAAAWLAANVPSSYAPIAAPMLSSKKKSERDAALAFVGEHPDLFEAATFEELLGARRADAREYGAHALGAIGAAGSRGALEASLAKEKSAKVKTAIELAIAAIAASSFDAGAFGEGAEGDAALDAALGGQPVVGPPGALAGGLDGLTAPTWSASGEPMSREALRWFVAELAREDEDRHSDDLVAIRARLEDAGCHALCEEMIGLRETPDHDWGLYPQALIASPERIEDTGARLETHASSQSYGWGSHGVNVLVRYGTDDAARILDDWHHKTRRDALRWRSASGVAQIAQAQGVSVEELLERSLPTYGFDARGEIEIDFGSQQFTFRLGAHNALEYVRDGKVLKSMPSVRKADDADKVAAAKSFIKRTRADIRRITRAQRRRFESAMFTGRSWDVTLWMERYARHPLMRSFIQGLIWGLCDADGALLTPFQLDESYDMVDADDDVVAWSEGQLVRIVHPIEMTAAQRSAWTQRFMDFEIVESFPQITRQVYHKADWPERGTALMMRFERVNDRVLLGHLSRQGFQLGPREDAGMINYSSREVGPYTITVSHSGISPEYEMGEDASLDGVSVSRDGERVELDDLPDNAFSELIADLVALTTA